MPIVFLCALVILGLVQLLRPQTLWQINRPLQRPFVKDYDATEPSPAGYLMIRVTGAGFLVVAVWMAVVEFT